MKANGKWCLFIGVLIVGLVLVSSSTLAADEVWVDDDAESSWYEDPTHFETIQGAVDAVADEGTVHVHAGEYSGWSFTYPEGEHPKQVAVKSLGGAVPEVQGDIVIDEGPDDFVNHEVNEFQVKGSTIKLEGSTSELRDGKNSEFLNNIIKNSGDKGLDIYKSDQNLMEDNTVNGSELSGILLHASNSNDVKDNLIKDNGQYGIWLLHANENNLIGNEIINNSENWAGILVDESDENNLIGNEIRNNGIGIWLNLGSDENDLIDNEIIDNGNKGILITGSDENNLIGNEIKNNEYFGIRIKPDIGERPVKNLIEGNIITGNGRKGISIKASNKNQLIGNTISGHTEEGIGLKDTKGSYIVTNNIYNNSTGILLDATSSGNSINYNSIHGNDFGVESDARVDATLNWWGDSTGPGGEGDGDGNEVSKNVVFSPWISGPDVDSEKDGIQIDTAPDPGVQLPSSVNITVDNKGPMPEGDTTLSGWIPGDDPSLPLRLYFVNESGGNDLIPTFGSVNYATDWDKIKSFLPKSINLEHYSISINSGDTIYLEKSLLELKKEDDQEIGFTKPIPMGSSLSYSILLKDEQIDGGSFEVGKDNVGASPDTFNSKPGYLNRAIGAANMLDGRDRIFVEPGDFSGAGVEPILDPVLIQGSGSNETMVKGTLPILKGADNTTITNIRFSESSVGVAIKGASDAKITNNTVGALKSNTTNWGTSSRETEETFSSSVEISNNTFLGQTEDGEGDGIAYGVYLLGGSNHTVKNNDFGEAKWYHEPTASAIYIGLSGDMQLAGAGNPSTNIAYQPTAGVIVEPGTGTSTSFPVYTSNVDITGNQITGPGPDPDSDNDFGIKLNQGTRETDINYNVISGWDRGIFAHESENEIYMIPKIYNEAHFNSITGNNEYGVFNEYDEEDGEDKTFDASLNYWGDPSGPSHPSNTNTTTGDAVSDNVIYSPWLDDSLPGSEEGIDADSTTPGVQLPDSVNIVVDDVGPAPDDGYLITALDVASSSMLPNPDTIRVRTDEGQADYSDVINRQLPIVDNIVVPSGESGEGLLFRRNRFLGSLTHNGTGTVDAQFNYWGSPPDVSGNKENVLVSPWLIKVPGSSPMTYVVDDIGAKPREGPNRAIADANKDSDRDTIIVNKGYYTGAEEPVTESANIRSETCPECSAFLTRIDSDMNLNSNGIQLGRREHGFTILGDIIVGGGVDPTSVHINWNDLLGNVTNNGSGILDARYNYWGGRDPEDATTGNVDTAPSFDVSVCIIEGYLRDNPTASIQEANAAIAAGDLTPRERAKIYLSSFGVGEEEAVTFIEDYGAVDINSSFENTESYTSMVSSLTGYGFGPAGGAGGILNNQVAGGAGSYKGTTVAAAYQVGETIEVNFDLSDFQGGAVKGAHGMITVSRLKEGGSEEVTALKPADYQEGSYTADVDTEGFEPGYYRIYIDLHNGSSAEMVVKVEG